MYCQINMGDAWLQLLVDFGLKIHKFIVQILHDHSENMVVHYKSVHMVHLVSTAWHAQNKTVGKLKMKRLNIFRMIYVVAKFIYVPNLLLPFWVGKLVTQIRCRNTIYIEFMLYNKLMTPFKISDQTHLILLGLPLSRCRILLFCSILQNVKYHTRSNNTYMLHSAATSIGGKGGSSEVARGRGQYWSETEGA